MPLSISWVLFAKVPIESYVKSRLAIDIGEKKALQVYLWMLQVQFDNFIQIHQECQKRNISFHIFCFISYPENINFNSAKKIMRKQWEKFCQLFSKSKVPEIYFEKQSSGNLGEKMSHAFLSVFKNTNYCILWGSDIPILCKKHFIKTLSLYPKCNIIPCKDGGYGLIALNKKLFQKEIFHNIHWSSTNTFSQQIQRLKECGIPYSIQEEIMDLDYYTDLDKNINYLKEKNYPEYQIRIKNWYKNCGNI